MAFDQLTAFSLVVAIGFGWGSFSKIFSELDFKPSWQSFEITIATSVTLFAIGDGFQHGGLLLGATIAGLGYTFSKALARLPKAPTITTLLSFCFLALYLKR